MESIKFNEVFLSFNLRSFLKALTNSLFLCTYSTSKYSQSLFLNNRLTYPSHPSKHVYIFFLGCSIKYLFILYLTNTYIIMSSSYHAILILKESELSNEQLQIFLHNLSKERLSEYLIKSNLLNKPSRLAKNEMIKLIVNDVMPIQDKESNVLPVNTGKMRIHDK